MIELAPYHKFGLPIKNPVMPSVGFFGYAASSYQPIIRGDTLGALVTNPITLRPQYHQAVPQAVENSGGVIFSTTPKNRGVRRIIKQYHTLWQRTPIPIIAHLPADVPTDLARTAGALNSLEVLSAFELGLPPDCQPDEVSRLINAIRQRSELPLLVKLPFHATTVLVASVVQAGVEGIVVSAPPHGTTMGDDKSLLEGIYFGAGIIPQIIPDLIRLSTTYQDISFIASGGVHSLADVKVYLAAGAKAVQIDSLIFIDPGRVAQILSNWS